MDERRKKDEEVVVEEVEPRSEERSDLVEGRRRTGRSWEEEDRDGRREAKESRFGEVPSGRSLTNRNRGRKRDEAE